MYTENQIEAWVASETRDLPMPDGSVRRHRAMRLVWEVFESLILLNGYGRAEIAGYAAEEAELQGIGFDEAFKGVVAWLDEQRRRSWGLN